MLEALAYEEKGVLLQKLHPLVLMWFTIVLFLQALLFDNPVFLLAIFITVLMIVMVSDAWEKCEFYLVSGLWMAVLLILVNTLVSHSGQTIILKLRGIPVLGSMDVCLEAVCFGAVMGVRLLIILLVFALYNATMHPDKIMNLLSRFAFKSALILSMSTRMLPAVARDVRAAMEAQQMRGVDFNSGSMRERLRKYSWLLNVSLISALEGSIQTAEAIQARAYGSGPRSTYQRFRLRPRDYICGLIVIISAICTGYGKMKGYGDYVFYPQMRSLLKTGSILTGLELIIVPLLLVVFIGWGWNHCPRLRSRI